MSKYYNSGPFRLSQWNSLLTDLNALLAKPPSGCTAVAPLPLNNGSHPWRVRDVTAVRVAMTATCSTIVFSTPLNVWKTNIIDEIESQFSKLFCKCGGGGGGGGGGWGPCINGVQSRSYTMYTPSENGTVTNNDTGYSFDISFSEPGVYYDAAGCGARLAWWEGVQYQNWPGPDFTVNLNGQVCASETFTETQPCLN